MARSHMARRLHLRLRLRMLLTWALCWLAHVLVQAAATYQLQQSLEWEAPAAAAAPRDWYVVLVSIPVLHKVLPLKNLAEELLYRGYRVGFALPENCRHWVNDLENLEFISLGNIVGRGRATYSDLDELSTLGVYESYAATLRYYASFQRPMFTALLEDLEDDRPNLVVVDRYTFAGIDVAHALQLPYVINNPFLLLDMDSPPAYVPAPFSNFSMHTKSVLERCLNSYHRLRFRLTMVHAFRDINQVRSDHGLAPIDAKDHLFGHQLVLVNSIFGLDDARPMTPQFQMLGVLRSRQIHSAKKSLPDAVLTWLTTPPPSTSHADETAPPPPPVGTLKPVIFVTFHPDVPLSPDFLGVLIDGLEAVHARLMFKITLQQQAAFNLRSRERSSLFFVGEDIDEATVLASGQLALVITAGESQTVQESLSAGLPVLGVPFSAEQLESVNAIVRANAGLVLTGATFNERSVKHAVNTLLYNGSYRAAARRLGGILQLGGGSVRAADFVVSVMEDGATNLLPMKNLQLLYKTYLVDVYMVYGAILCGAAVILRTFVSVVCSVFQAPMPMLEPVDDNGTLATTTAGCAAFSHSAGTPSKGVAGGTATGNGIGLENGHPTAPAHSSKVAN
ncbi:TPA: hypothetical protein N0F65_011539 [Lagenidium giganteum]|uniref:Glucuronosyltransferase n=1 Tax=Lagenidium giganteum TaxID=4803 RepID=A0AAV2Z3Q2_9STRA|nr:TPA: hypothetical protein N0F65_011539 [Lagenidium giganteum]